MGNSYSGLPKKLEGVESQTLTPQQRDYLEKLKEHCQQQTIHNISMFLGRKVPNYFQAPLPMKKVVLPPLPGKEPPGTIIPYNPPSYAPPVPSFVHFHPLADLLRRHLLLHVYSDRFGNAIVPKEKLFALGADGEGEGKFKVGYVYVIKLGPKAIEGVSMAAGVGSVAVESSTSESPSPGKASTYPPELSPSSSLGKAPTYPPDLSPSQKALLHHMIPQLSKFRILVSTKVSVHTPNIKYHHHTNPPPVPMPNHRLHRTKTLHIEITPLDKNNQLIRPPGILAIEIRVANEYLREMRWLEDAKDWDWCVQILREVLRMLLGKDGGVWKFLWGKNEGVATWIEGDGWVSCWVIREGGI